MKFKLWLERTFSYLRRPTHVKYMTTYHMVIQWEGKLTGKPYYFKDNTTLVQGVSPAVRVKEK